MSASKYQPQSHAEGQVTVEDNVVYDVSAKVEDIPRYGTFLAIEAQYNADATSANYEQEDDIHNTGPVKFEYAGRMPVLGDVSLTEENLDTYFDALRKLEDNGSGPTLMEL